MNKWLSALVGLWFIGCLGGMLYVADQRLVSFDPELTLLDQSLSINFDQNMTQAFKQAYGSVANTAFHLSDSGCFCANIASAHIKRVSQALSAQEFHNQFVTRSNSPHHALFDAVPSTPAVVVFDQQERLVFLGPYSQGMLCSGNNGFIETLLTALTSAEQHLGAQVISDAKGCYCPT